MTLILNDQNANAWVGAAHAPSPDVRSGPPGLHSLGGVCAPASMPALAAYAGSWGTGSPYAFPTQYQAWRAGLVAAATCGRGGVKQAEATMARLARKQAGRVG